MFITIHLLATCNALRLVVDKDDTRALTSELWNRFWSSEGVVMQMFECNGNFWKSGNQAECLERHLSSPTASVLRYDVPAVTFQHANQYGIIYKKPALEQQWMAWIQDSACSTTGNVAKPVACKRKNSLQECKSDGSPKEWAKTIAFREEHVEETLEFWERQTEMEGGPQGYGGAQCFFSSFAKMLDHHSAVLQVISEKWTDKMAGKYAGMQCFYNQAQLKQSSVSDIEAIFYANHSDTQFLHKISSASKGRKKPVKAEYQVNRPHEEALSLAKHLETTYNRKVPVIQFNHQDDECWSPKIALNRVDSGKNKENIQNIFQEASEL